MLWWDILSIKDRAKSNFWPQTKISADEESVVFSCCWRLLTTYYLWISNFIFVHYLHQSFLRLARSCIPVERIWIERIWVRITNYKECKKSLKKLLTPLWKIPQNGKLSSNLKRDPEIPIPFDRIFEGVPVPPKIYEVMLSHHKILRDWPE